MQKIWISNKILRVCGLWPFEKNRTNKRNRKTMKENTCKRFTRTDFTRRSFVKMNGNAVELGGSFVSCGEKKNSLKINLDFQWSVGFSKRIRFAYLWLRRSAVYVIWLISFVYLLQNPYTVLAAEMFDEHRLLYISPRWMCAQCGRPVEMAHVVGVFVIRSCMHAWTYATYKLVCLHRVRIRYTNYKRFYFSNRTTATEHIRDLFSLSKTLYAFCGRGKVNRRDILLKHLWCTPSNWLCAVALEANRIYTVHTHCNIQIDCAKTLNPTKFHKSTTKVWDRWLT